MAQRIYQEGVRHPKFAYLWYNYGCVSYLLGDDNLAVECLKVICPRQRSNKLL